jgi:hypothetical protein
MSRWKRYLYFRNVCLGESEASDYVDIDVSWLSRCAIW